MIFMVWYGFCKKKKIMVFNLKFYADVEELGNFIIYTKIYELWIE